MANLKQMGSREKKNYFQPCLDAGVLAARKPNTKSYFEIRIIPQIDANGDPLPLIRSITQAGAEYTNMLTEPIVVNAGASSRFSGLSRSSDRLESDEADTVYSRLFINARSAQKRREVPEELRDEVDGYLMNGELKAPLSRVSTMAMVQCVVTALEGKPLEKPLPKQVVFLTSTAAADLDDKLCAAHEKGVDVADPAEGRVLRFTPEEQRGTGISMFTVTIGDKMPIKLSSCRKLWVEWETALIRKPFDDLIRSAVNGFSLGFVSWVFPMDCGRLFSNSVKPKEVTPPTGKGASVVDQPVVEEADDGLQLDLEAPPALDEEEAPPENTTTSNVAGSAGNAVPTEETPEEAAARYESMLEDI